MAFTISKEKTTKGMMSTFGKLYEKSSASNKVFLIKHLFNMKILEGGSVAYHLNEFNTLTSQLSYTNVNFDDEVRALLILCSLPESWNILVLGPGKLLVTIVGILPNKRSQLARYCLVWGICQVYNPATVGQVTIKVFYRLRPGPPCIFLVF